LRGKIKLSSTSGISMFNKNQVKGVIKDAAGKVQEEAGKLVGNKEQEAKGLKKKTEGKSEKILGDAGLIKEAAEKVQEEARKLFGNKERAARGLKKKTEGKSEKIIGDAEEVVKDARDTLKDAVKKP
jgi:uncharacterized protein YjbJ (UPF0337 family)